MPEEVIEAEGSPFARYNKIMSALTAAHANGELTGEQYSELRAEADGCRLAEETRVGVGIPIDDYLRGTGADRLKGEEYYDKKKQEFFGWFWIEEGGAWGQNDLTE